MERKNRILVDISCTMLIDTGIAKNFWAGVVNTAFYVINRCLIRFILEKTPYDLLTKRKSKMSYLKYFGCKCFILKNRNNDQGKFGLISDEGTFVSYYSNSKAYSLFNKRTQCIEEDVHMVFNEVGSLCEGHVYDDVDLEDLLQAPGNSASGEK